MNHWMLDHPMALWGMPLLLLPLVRLPLVPSGYPWRSLLPIDAVSHVINLGLRLAGCVAFGGLLLGVGGLHKREAVVERRGFGAEIVLLLDRSRSMDDSFVGRAPAGGEESKARAAARLLPELILAKDRHDRIGVVAFSTSPLFVLPFTDDREAVLAAVASLRYPNLAQTNIGKGLALALSFFDPVPPHETARAIVLVSDGAAVMDAESENKLRRWFQERKVHLHWIFLRTLGSPGLYEIPADPGEDIPEARPERHLHRFFGTLGISYQAYEVEDPAALGRAVAAIEREERYPLRYFERLPRRDLQTFCYVTAALAIAVVGMAKTWEVRR
jgi:mxaC protein